MFAIIKSGGKQYTVRKNSIVRIEKLAGEPGAAVEFNEVMMIGDQNRPLIIGTPLVSGALVKAEIINQGRDNKIIVFKKKRRHNYRRKNGHRQYVTDVLIKDISRA